MNDSEFDSAVEAYFEGRLGEGQWEGFDRELQGSARRRARFWELAEVHALARDAWCLSSAREESLPVTQRAPRIWGGWGLAAALLAGAFLGIGGAGAVWAVASSQGRAIEIRSVGLEEERTGKQGAPLPRGLSRQAALAWSGDVMEWAHAAEFSKPTLRFLEAAGEGDQRPASSCDLYRIVDLRTLADQRMREQAVLEFSAEFLDHRSALGDLVRFTARVQLYSGDPEDFVRRWPESRQEAVSLGSDTIGSSGGAPGAWRRVVAHTFVPRQANFALLQVVATRAAEDGPARFGEQYVRAISLKLRPSASP